MFRPYFGARPVDPNVTWARLSDQVRELRRNGAQIRFGLAIDEGRRDSFGQPAIPSVLGNATLRVNDAIIASRHVQHDAHGSLDDCARLLWDAFARYRDDYLRRTGGVQ